MKLKSTLFALATLGLSACGDNPEDHYSCHTAFGTAALSGQGATRSLMVLDNERNTTYYSAGLHPAGELQSIARNFCRTGDLPNILSETLDAGRNHYECRGFSGNTAKVERDLDGVTIALSDYMPAPIIDMTFEQAQRNAHDYCVGKPAPNAFGYDPK